MNDIERKTFAVESKADGKPGTFTGYASVWGNPDSYGDIMVRGAFEESMAIRGLPMLSYEHEWGLGPIGELTSASEDDYGLKVEGVLYTDDPLVNRIWRSMRAGGLTEMSFAFITKDAEHGELDGEPVRYVRSVDWLEAAVVVKGANDRAQLVAVRNEPRATEEALGLDTADEQFESRLKELFDQWAADAAQTATATQEEQARREYLESLAMLGLTDTD